MDKINWRLIALNKEIDAAIEKRLKTPLSDPLTRRELSKKIYLLKGERKGLNWTIENFTTGT